MTLLKHICTICTQAQVATTGTDTDTTLYAAPTATAAHLERPAHAPSTDGAGAGRRSPTEGVDAAQWRSPFRAANRRLFGACSSQAAAASSTLPPMARTRRPAVWQDRK